MNSKLIRSAEQAGYELLVTTDQNMKYQQNLQGRRLAILVLGTTSWRALRAYTAELANLIDQIQVGEYREFLI